MSYRDVIVLVAGTCFVVIGCLLFVAYARMFHSERNAPAGVRAIFYARSLVTVAFGVLLLIASAEESIALWLILGGALLLVFEQLVRTSALPRLAAGLESQERGAIGKPHP